MIMNSEKSEFQSDAYLEYRRRVYQQLAADYDKEKREQLQQSAHAGRIFSSNDENNVLCPPYVNPADNKAKDESDLSLNCSPDVQELQPAWDNSDLHSELNISSPNGTSTSNCLNFTSPTETMDSVGLLHCNNNVSRVQDSFFNNITVLHCEDGVQKQPLTKCSVFNEMKSKMQEAEFVKHEGINNNQTALFSCSSTRPGFESSCQVKECNSIPYKISLEDAEKIKFKDDSDIPCFERPYSADDQSLQICYINETCSLDENDDVNGCKESTEDQYLNELSFPNQPSVVSLRRNGNHCLEEQGVFVTPSVYSATSFTPIKNTNRIIRFNHYKDGKLKQEHIEVEARFQLAKAHQQVKHQAQKERQESRSQNNLSLTQQLLSISLTDHIASKIKDFSLTKQDCHHMKVVHLHLLLKDMHAKKKGLNDQLMNLLVIRDKLQTEQDAKLLDIEDAKAFLNDIGPESTV